MTCPDLCDPCADDARCSECGERMCQVYGAYPRPCGTTCTDCPCDCGTPECAEDEAERAWDHAEQRALDAARGK